MDLKNYAQLATQHYENFPVASIILPANIRKPVRLIYAFARLADDLADEPLPNATPESRIQALNEFATQLSHPTEALFVELNQVILDHQLDRQLFLDLLTAFKQDVTKSNYLNFSEVLEYCRHSANPIGRLLLALTKTNTVENQILSDHICTGLQLINFLQDWQDDLITRNRCYIPVSFQTEYHCALSQNLVQTLDLKNPDLFLLLQHFHTQTAAIFQAGIPLGKNLSGRFGFYLRVIIQSGQRVLAKLKNRTVLNQRCRLTLFDWPLCFVKGLF